MSLDGYRAGMEWFGTYMDAPELLDGVEGDDLLQEIVPVVTLVRRSVSCTIVGLKKTPNLSARWFSEPQSPSVH